jgi:hypothetical protein
MSMRQAEAWIVAGPVDAGKSTVAESLLAESLLAESLLAESLFAELQPTPALLDRDTMYNPLEEAILAMEGRPFCEREGPWHDGHCL